jgi:MFS family permease
VRVVTTGRRPAGVFFGWWIVAGGVALQMLPLGLLTQAYGLYVVALQGEFGWSATAFSFASAAQRAESGILGPVQGWLVDRFGPRAVIRVGTVLFGAGFILFSRIDALPASFATFLLMAIGSSIAGFMPIITTVAQWFDRRRAAAIGVMQTGMGARGTAGADENKKTCYHTGSDRGRPPEHSASDQVLCYLLPCRDQRAEQLLAGE